MNEPTPGTGQPPHTGAGSDQPPAGSDATGISAAGGGERTDSTSAESEKPPGGEPHVPDDDTLPAGADTQEPGGSDSEAEPGEAALEESAPGEAAPEAPPRPLGLGTEPTGHPSVDVQLHRLTDADHLAVSGHQEVYEDVHRGLRDALAALDSHDPGS